MLSTCSGMHYCCRELLQAVIRRTCYGAVAGGGLYADRAGALVDLNERALTLRIEGLRMPAMQPVCSRACLDLCVCLRSL